MYRAGSNDKIRFICVYVTAKYSCRQNLSELFEAYLFTHETFKDKKKDWACMKFRIPSDLGPYRITWLIKFLFPLVLVDSVLIKSTY